MHDAMLAALKTSPPKNKKNKNLPKSGEIPIWGQLWLMLTVTKEVSSAPYGGQPSPSCSPPTAQHSKTMLV